MTYKPFALRDIARQSLVQMLSEDIIPMDPKSPETNSDSSFIPSDTIPHWKILIHDPFTRNILATLLKFHELQELGVTLHLGVLANREPVVCSPGVYFILPTADNVRRIACDIKTSLYASFDVNFSGSCTTELLQLFAQELAEGVDVLPPIRIRDWPLCFAALENDFFSLEHKGFYMQSHVPKFTTNTPKNDHPIDDIVDSIAAVSRALRLAPYIAGSRTPSCLRLVEAVSNKLKEDSENSKGFPRVSSFMGQQRPLLLLVDRNMDLITPLHTPFSYGALLADTMEMQLNKVGVEESNPASSDLKTTPNVSDTQKKKKTIFLDDTDEFWRENFAKDFSQVCERVESSFSQFSAQRQKLTQEGAEELPGLMSHVPKLAEQKRHLDSHTTLCHAIVRHVQDRDLDRAHAMDRQLMRVAWSRGGGLENIDFTLLKDLILSNTSKRTWKDRMRTLLVYALCLEQYQMYHRLDGIEETDCVEGDHLEQFCNELMKRFPEHTTEPKQVLSLVRTMCTVYLEGCGPDKQNDTAIEAGRWEQKISDVARKLATSLTEDSNLLSPLVELIEVVMSESRTTQEDSSLLPNFLSSGEDVRQNLLRALWCIDPFTHNAIDIAEHTFSSCVVVVVGGLTYTEYYDLGQWKIRPENRGKNVIVGGTEFIAGCQFLDQLVETARFTDKNELTRQ